MTAALKAEILQEVRKQLALEAAASVARENAIGMMTVLSLCTVF